MSSQTNAEPIESYYNVYLITFKFPDGAKLVGLGLVASNSENQNKGRLYRVTGTVGLGMEYEFHEQFDWKEHPISTRKEKELMCQILKSHLEHWENIAQHVSPPHFPQTVREPIAEHEIWWDRAWVDQVLWEATPLKIWNQRDPTPEPPKSPIPRPLPPPPSARL